MGSIPSCLKPGPTGRPGQDLSAWGLVRDREGAKDSRAALNLEKSATRAGLEGSPGLRAFRLLYLSSQTQERK